MKRDYKLEDQQDRIRDLESELLSVRATNVVLEEHVQALKETIQTLGKALDAQEMLRGDGGL